MISTDGNRIYAIGDIHGCLIDLKAMIARIDADLRNRPHARPTVILVGDYTDRGPDSKGVLDYLISFTSRRYEIACLFGNHDELFLTYLSTPDWRLRPDLHWLNPRLGGDKTLLSYGIAGASEDRPGATHRAFADAVPAAHTDFLSSLPTSRKIGSYFFVHAGIRPGFPLHRQITDDLIWIRGPFLDSREDHGAIIVHGHTPVDKAENHGNRIAIDTGLVYGRHLTCLVLEDEKQELLRSDDPDGYHPMPF